ncbi:uncharacterized protein LOC122481530 [Prionailurus bengalensis]|uniref:uncharacterized protein LOC122481530 n=1 Tax=Prionailurus bengalensis TaxID=37029 RepID=UPI001CA9C94C|nr:uncharacterized protein LOC122481530 [Prionailurus bengalensis]
MSTWWNVPESASREPEPPGHVTRLRTRTDRYCSAQREAARLEDDRSSISPGPALFPEPMHCQDRTEELFLLGGRFHPLRVLNWLAGGRARACFPVCPSASSTGTTGCPAQPPTPTAKATRTSLSPRLRPPWPGSRKPGNLHQEIHFNGWDCGCGGAAGNEDVAVVHAHAEPGVQACDLTGCREAGADYPFQKAALRAVHTHLQGEAKRHPESCF